MFSKQASQEKKLLPEWPANGNIIQAAQQFLLVGNSM